MSEKTVKSGKPWMRVLLVVSLGLNLLIAGIVAGAFFTGHDKPRGKAQERNSFALGPYGRALSKEDRQALRGAVEGRKAWFAQSRQQMRGFGKEMVEAVRAEPFRAEAVADILTRQSEVHTAFRKEGRDLLLGRIEAMTPDQRSAFADKLEKGLNRSKRDR